MPIISSDHGLVGSDLPGDDADIAATFSHYCYLFPDLADAEVDAPLGDAGSAKQFERLNRLASLMDELAVAQPHKSHIPTAYTYFGQFLNHDISAPIGTTAFSNAGRANADPTGVEPGVIANLPDLVALMAPHRPPSPAWILANIANRHPAPLTLDSVYGDGPSSSSADIRGLYSDADPVFRLGSTFPISNEELASLTNQPETVSHHPSVDLLRDASINEAMIADRRNDENLIVSQLHLAFLKLHNRVVAILRPQFGDRAKLFAAARQLVTWHYQWCVVHDYLERLIPGAGARACTLLLRGEVPIEFTSAAFRFGHSMVGRAYDYNENFGEGRPLGPASLTRLFNFTSRRFMGGVSDPAKRLPDHWVIDWETLTATNPLAGGAADRIDPQITNAMSALPGSLPDIKVEAGLSSICHRNLRRGHHRFIASGQTFAAALGIQALKPAQICEAFGTPQSATFLRDCDFDRQTPAWAYFLCEAAVLRQGEGPGPVAGAIITETIIGLLKLDPGSVLHADGGAWTPSASPLRMPDGAPVSDLRNLLKLADSL